MPLRSGRHKYLKISLFIFFFYFFSITSSSITKSVKASSIQDEFSYYSDYLLKSTLTHTTEDWDITFAGEAKPLWSRFATVTADYINSSENNLIQIERDNMTISYDMVEVFIKGNDHTIQSLSGKSQLNVEAHIILEGLWSAKDEILPRMEQISPGVKLRWARKLANSCDKGLTANWQAFDMVIKTVLKRLAKYDSPVWDDFLVNKESIENDMQVLRNTFNNGLWDDANDLTKGIRYDVYSGSIARNLLFFKKISNDAQLKGEINNMLYKYANTWLDIITLDGTPYYWGRSWNGASVLSADLAQLADEGFVSPSAVLGFLPQQLEIFKEYHLNSLGFINHKLRVLSPSQSLESYNSVASITGVTTQKLNYIARASQNFWNATANNPKEKYFAFPELGLAGYHDLNTGLSFILNMSQYETRINNLLHTKYASKILSPTFVQSVGTWKGMPMPYSLGAIAKHDSQTNASNWSYLIKPKLHRTYYGGGLVVGFSKGRMAEYGYNLEKDMSSPIIKSEFIVAKDNSNVIISRLSSKTASLSKIGISSLPVPVSLGDEMQFNISSGRKLSTSTYGEHNIFAKSIDGELKIKSSSFRFGNDDSQGNRYAPTSRSIYLDSSTNNTEWQSVVHFAYSKSAFPPNIVNWVQLLKKTKNKYSLKIRDTKLALYENGSSIATIGALSAHSANRSLRVFGVRNNGFGGGELDKISDEYGTLLELSSPGDVEVARGTNVTTLYLNRGATISKRLFPKTKDSSNNFIIKVWKGNKWVRLRSDDFLFENDLISFDEEIVNRYAITGGIAKFRIVTE